MELRDALAANKYFTEERELFKKPAQCDIAFAPEKGFFQIDVLTEQDRHFQMPQAIKRSYRNNGVIRPFRVDRDFFNKSGTDLGRLMSDVHGRPISDLQGRFVIADDQLAVAQAHLCESPVRELERIFMQDAVHMIYKYTHG